MVLQSRIKSSSSHLNNTKNIWIKSENDWHLQNVDIFQIWIVLFSILDTEINLHLIGMRQHILHMTTWSISKVVKVTVRIIIWLWMFLVMERIKIHVRTHTYVARNMKLQSAVGSSCLCGTTNFNLFTVPPWLWALLNTSKDIGYTLATIIAKGTICTVNNVIRRDF